MNSLEVFHPITARWFAQAIGTPTAVQQQAWPAIAAGGHTLVSAPTGTGKTLSAFLVFIDRLMTQSREGKLEDKLQLIYISPLKSLAGDIRENLRRPLDGIAQVEQDEGAIHGEVQGIRVSIRTGDTSQSERRRMITTPPHILITTPESLFLMLTVRSGQSILHTAKWLIIDELHALIDTKRGAHLMLSLARLDRLCGTPVQRIGLSATIEPLSRAAEYLSSAEPAAVISPGMRKDIELAVTSPFTGERIIQKDTSWQQIAAAIYKRCEGTRSAIAFVEGRAYAEKLAYYMNELGGEGFARTHHGSLSKERRFEVEHALRTGTLRLLCATSSMELGIDVGDIDQVFQVGCPRSISSTMQRLGRAGHSPGRVSVMHIYPRTASEGLYSGLAAQVVRDGGVEHCHPPRLCLDVLAQHLVSMAAADSYTVDDVMEVLPRAYPFRDVTREDVRDVLRMLAGDYEHERDIPVRPRLLYDRIHDRVEPDTYSRMLAVSAGGTIPDRGLYTAKTQNGVKLGELDEEFVYESRVGDKFLLGSFAWQIVRIGRDSVEVAPAATAGARLPFWHGDLRGRRLQTGLAYGAILRRLSGTQGQENLLDELRRLGLDETAAQGAMEFLHQQMSVTGTLPDDRTMIIEHFRDETGINQMMVHSVMGRPVNEPLAILACEVAKRQTDMNISYIVDDDGFLLFPYGENPLPRGLLHAIVPQTAQQVLSAVLPATPVFGMTFRYNSAHALMMGMRNAGRQPLWVQRMRSADMLNSLVRQEDHPLMRETKRECMEDCWDLPGVQMVLQGIRSGAIAVREQFMDEPSPMSLPLRQQTEAANMYDYAPTTTGIHQAVQDALDQAQMIAPAPEQLERVSARARLPENENQLHSLLMIEGDLMAGELDIPIQWLEALARRQQVQYIEPGLWIAAEHAEKYTAALMDADTQARADIVRRVLRYRGAQSADSISERYLWPEEVALEVLAALCAQGSAVESEGTYYHAELYDRARRETVLMRRRQIRTLPPQSYAALLADRTHVAAPAQERLEAALNSLGGQPFPAFWWESVLLPGRVPGYRPEMLDKLLAQGAHFWRIAADGDISFHRYEDIDWDADLAETAASLQGTERTIYDELRRRGASFQQRLSELMGGVPPHDTLMELAERGLVCADSFVPVRQWLDRKEMETAPLKRRVKARVLAMTAGRWELARPLTQLTVEQRLERLFDRAVILCRETMQEVSWAAALEVLRVWEYTGHVRRGYFVAGMSGIQFIRDKDFVGVMLALEQPRNEVLWLPAVDPAQPWGKSLPHLPERSFLNVPGSAVALRAGVPVAVLERQGKTLRVFEEDAMPEAMAELARLYAARRLLPQVNRLTVKQYPPQTAQALQQAGFHREMQDYVLYRGVR